MENTDKNYSLKEVEYFVKLAWFDGNNNTDKNGTPSYEIYAISDESYWEQIKEKIEVNIRTEASHKSIDDKVVLLKKEISELKYAANNNHAMTDEEKEWSSLHLGTVIERLEKIFESIEITRQK